MSHRIRLAADAHLFLVDDAGILFSELRQEIHLFNTTAAFVWCCLEEGLSLEAATAAYAGSFQVDRDEAHSAIAGSLQRWQAQGFLSGVEEPPEAAIDLNTALARLLRSASLREAFARSPAALARAWFVRDGDLEAFLALAPEQLEAEADLLAERRSALRNEHSSPGAERVLGSALGIGRALLESAVDARRSCAAAPALHRHYRLASTSFCLRFGSAALEAVVHPVIAHLASEASDEVHCELLLLEAPDGCVLLEGLLPVGRSDRPDRIVPLVGATLQQVASRRHPHLLQIHAGVISDGTRCMLLPGAPGAGKSTLTAAASASGFQYFSDELALLEHDTLSVRPLPMCFTLKQGSIAPLSGLFPAIRELPAYVREDAEVVRYLPPAQDALRSDRERSYPVRWIVFPRYTPDRETELRPLGRPETLERLLQECLVLPELLDRRKLESLACWIRSIDCFELPMSSHAAALPLLRRLVAEV